MSTRARLLPRTLVTLCLLAACTTPTAPTTHGTHGTATAHWSDWSPAVFERARAEDRLVLLHLGAVWCHWCHVMEQQTWSDARVQAIVARSFVPVHVDQDARPDLANRYRDYGWPATIVFDGDGRELVKLRGYVPPARMRTLLESTASERRPLDDDAARSMAQTPSLAGLDDALRATLEQRLWASYDAELGGFGRPLKRLDAEALEWCALRADAGDAQARDALAKTLANERLLIDPVWGGVWQYSDDNVWTNPHYEKVVWRQADDVRAFAQAWARERDPAHLVSALDVVRWVRAFLTSPDGAIHTSQDADVVPGQHAADYFALDDAGRRARGVPRVDTSVYARENGQWIEALCRLHAATGRADLLADARRAAECMLRERARGDGGFRHGERTDEPAFLAATLWMGRAFLALHEVTAEPVWLERACAAARFVDATFGPGPGGAGYATVAQGDGVLPPEPDFEESWLLARWANALARRTGDAAHRAMAERAMRAIASPDTALRRGNSPAAILLADLELASEPVHVTVVGARDDPQAELLFATALAMRHAYRRVDWRDPREPAATSDIAFPTLDLPAAYLCAGGACSAPITSAGELEGVLRAPGPAR